MRDKDIILSEERKQQISNSQIGGNNSHAKKIICNKTGKIYHTVKEAALDKNITSSALSNKLNKRRKNDTGFKYLHDKNEFMDGKSLQEIKKDIILKAIDYYGSRALAARKLKIGRATIQRLLKDQVNA